MVAELIAHPNHPKNEPSYRSPHYLAEITQNKDLTTEIAPSYERNELLEKLSPASIPMAAWQKRTSKQETQRNLLISRSSHRPERRHNCGEEPKDSGIEHHRPNREVVAELIAHANQAKNEPSYRSPLWLAEMTQNKDLTTEIAPSYERNELLEKLTAASIPKAA